KRLVIDLRGNGGGLLEEAVKIVSLFVPKGTLVVSSKGRGDNTRMNRSSYTADDPIDTEIPLMVMVNSSSASASEIVAGAIQDLDRGVIAGTRTFGKGLVQSIHPTSYNGSVKITTAHYYTPSGRCVQAIDYSRRNADGSVGVIPDSLTHVFYTKKGRPVHDGGGITPDIISEAYAYSRPSASLVYNDILGDYSIKYYIEHKNIDKIEDIALTDADYEDFIAYAKNFDFDYRSGMQTEIENLIKVAKYDGIYEKCREQIEALAKSVDIDKETTLRDKKAEIIPLIEVELAGKYFFQSGAGQVALRDDSQLYNALDKWDTVKL
ncbi:MAG: peptidase S41, partial [Bacteroidales bacterium]|nr:peptidase S41 [Bacteroidales bacterium]